MRQKLKLAPLGVLLVILAGCGGGGGLLNLGGEDLQYGAIGASFNGSCASFSAGIVGNHSSKSEAATAAINECLRAGGTNCSIYATFGSAYQGAVDCGALSFGTNPSADSCGLYAGQGNSITDAENHAVSRCRGDGNPSCRLVKTTTGGRFGLCSN